MSQHSSGSPLCSFTTGTKLGACSYGLQNINAGNEEDESAHGLGEGQVLVTFVREASGKHCPFSSPFGTSKTKNAVFL